MAARSVTSLAPQPKASARGSACPGVGGAPPHAEQIAELFNRYYAGLVRSLAARTKSWDEARDLASQAFAELLALKRPESVGFFGAYLYRTARNLTTNHLIRRGMRQRKDPLVGEAAEPFSPSPEPAVAEQQRRALLQRALQRLPAHWRMALMLRVWDELPYREILARFAQMGVDLTERTARRYVAAALEQCRREILSEEDDPPRELPQ